MQAHAGLPEHTGFYADQTNTLCSKYLRCIPVTRKKKKKEEEVALDNSLGQREFGERGEPVDCVVWGSVSAFSYLLQNFKAELHLVEIRRHY